MKQGPETEFTNGDGIKYKVIWKAPHRNWNADGLCDSPESKKPQIWITPDLEEKRLLEVTIEEIFHAHFFEKSEKEARKFSANLRRILYKAGWRKT